MNFEEIRKLRDLAVGTEKKSHVINIEGIRFASFEEWSKLVKSALDVITGMTDEELCIIEDESWEYLFDSGLTPYEAAEAILEREEAEDE